MATQTCDSRRDNGLLSRGAVDDHAAGGTPWTTGPVLRVIHARSIDDAFELIRVVRGNQAVLLNHSLLDTGLGSRLIDICSGGVCAMDGQVHRIGAELVLFAPALTRVSAS